MRKHVLKVKKVSNIWEKSTGLIGKKSPEALFLQTRFGIHTFGLRFPIDVVILDDKMTVVKLKESLKPLRIFLWNMRYKNIVELPKETIMKKKIEINDVIQLVPSNY